MEELKFSFLKIINIIQDFEFSYVEMILKKDLVNAPHIQKMNPFLDKFTSNDYGISCCLIRVGSRLANANIPSETKFPLLLGKESYFLMAYLKLVHLRNHHAGATIWKALLRERIWVLNAQEISNKVVRNCIRSFWYKP